MLRQIECSRAIAETVALCRPQVICAYPITPQTHIVEGLAELVREGQLAPCEFINVESEFAALSVAIGASATGARAYTATASQGLLFMAEAVYNASGMGLPIVMTLGNRAVGAPINIWNDHSDVMSMKDAGWIQLFAADNQEAVDLHLLAFRVAEELSLPVMVNVDGFVLTHSFERVDVPTQAQVDAFLPPYRPVQVLDPAHPITMGAMVGPEAFTEVRYLAHARQLEALERLPALARELGACLGRPPLALVRPYRSDDAETVVVALGSVNGTLQVVVDELRGEGASVGAVGLCTLRPFPGAALAAALAGARRVVVLERSLAPGVGGSFSADLAAALPAGVPVHTVIAGLGGRPILRASLRRLLGAAAHGDLPRFSFLDLDQAAVDREIATRQRSVP